MTSEKSAGKISKYIGDPRRDKYNYPQIHSVCKIADIKYAAYRTYNVEREHCRGKDLTDIERSVRKDDNGKQLQSKEQKCSSRLIYGYPHRETWNVFFLALHTSQALHPAFRHASMDQNRGWGLQVGIVEVPSIEEEHVSYKTSLCCFREWYASVCACVCVCVCV